MLTHQFGLSTGLVWPALWSSSPWIQEEGLVSARRRIPSSGYAIQPRAGDKKGELLGSRGGRKDEAVFSLSLAAYNALGDAEGVELARRDKEPLPCEAPELNPLPLHCY